MPSCVSLQTLSTRTHPFFMFIPFPHTCFPNPVQAHTSHHKRHTFYTLTIHPTFKHWKTFSPHYPTLYNSPCTLIQYLHVTPPGNPNPFPLSVHTHTEVPAHLVHTHSSFLTHPLPPCLHTFSTHPLLLIYPSHIFYRLIAHCSHTKVNSYKSLLTPCI